MICFYGAMDQTQGVTHSECSTVVLQPSPNFEDMTQKLSSSSVVVFSLWPTLTPNPDLTRILSTDIWEVSGALHSEESGSSLSEGQLQAHIEIGVWLYKKSKRIPHSKIHLNISVAFGGIWAWTELNFTSWGMGSYLGKWSGSLAFCHKGGGKNPNQKRDSKIHEVSTW